MKYTKLGRADLTVSRICMGCMGFGDPAQGQHSWTLDEEYSREIIRHGLEAGINFYDTAIAYQSGTSEQYVGRALRDFGKRDEVVVATKFLPRTQEEIAEGVTGQMHIGRMLTKVTSPVVGATRFHHVDGAAKATDLELMEEEIAYLEAPYVPHPLAGVMAQNKPANAKEKHVWSTGNQKI